MTEAKCECGLPIVRAEGTWWHVNTERGYDHLAKPVQQSPICMCGHTEDRHHVEGGMLAAFCAACPLPGNEHEFKPVAPSQSVEALKRAVMDAAPLWENVDVALDALIEAVRREQDGSIATEVREQAE